MKILEKYIDFIDDEISGAKDYAKCAYKWKEDNNTKYSTMFIEMANQELTHALKLHDIVAELIDKEKADLKEKNIEIPEYMLYEWNKSHNNYIEKVAEIKYMIEIAK